MNSEPKSAEDYARKCFRGFGLTSDQQSLMSYEIREALQSYLLQESRELVEALKYILETSKALDKDSLEPDKVLCHAQQIRFRSLSSLATFQQKHGGV